ncbi:lipopolysaccharide biosynthesis protein [Actinomycetospora rhizophila]|uniref:Lipopolysaccharide biosynthesis protein n=1 Tax=Actinomycetospora rhizophila TaxID=1416876 RepID=A0ABV9ZLL3_9PSEU
MRVLACRGELTPTPRPCAFVMTGRVRTLVGRLPSSLRGVSSIVAGSAIGQGLVILAYPLLTRLYDPAEFGLLTVFTAVVGLVGVVSTAALEYAVPIPVEDSQAASVAWAGLGWVALTGLLTAALGPLLAGPLSDLLGVPRLADVWWLVALSVVVLGTYLLLSEWMTRSREYGALGRRNALQGIGQAGSQIAFGVAGAGALGLLSGFGIGRLAAMGGLFSRRGLLRQPWPGRRAIIAALRRFRRFPLVAMPSRLINSAGLDTPLLVVSALYGDVRAGLLGLTVRVVSGPAALIGEAVTKVFVGDSSSELRDRKSTMGASVRSNVGRMLMLGVVPALVLLLFAPNLFGWVFGPEWTEAGEYARLLAPAYLAQFAIAPVSPALMLLERQGRLLGWSVWRLVLAAGGPAVCGLAGAPILTAVLVLSAAQVTSYVLMYFLCVRAADASDASGASL